MVDNKKSSDALHSVSCAQRRPNPSLLYRRRMVLLVVLTAVIAVVSLSLGRYGVPIGDIVIVLQAMAIQCVNGCLQWLAAAAAWLCQLFGFADMAHALSANPPQLDYAAEATMSEAYITIVHVRFPRIMVALLVGAALSVAGAAYQGMFQNPMASQDVLGASSGAAFGAALGILLGVGSIFISVAAFAFGLVAVFISYAISRTSRSNPILSMVLAGMVISALFSSGTSFIKLVADTEDALPAITYWLMGSLASIRPSDVIPVLLLLLVAGIPLFLLRWRINLLATGEEEAHSLGLNASALRVAVILCATFMTATCVSVSGLIGWVGLVIPHFCRLLFGSDYRRVIPACMLLGAVFLLLVDDLSRLLVTSEIPLGILTSFVGAPIFVWLIMKGGGTGAPRGR